MNGEEQPLPEAQQAEDVQPPQPAAPAVAKGERGPDQEVLIITDKGYGIRTNLNGFRKAHRGTKGTRAMFLNEKNGNLVAAKIVKDGDTVTIFTKNGQAGLFDVDEVKCKGRGISGVRVVTLADDDAVIAVV